MCWLLDVDCYQRLSINWIWRFISFVQYWNLGPHWLKPWPWKRHKQMTNATHLVVRWHDVAHENVIVMTRLHHLVMMRHGMHVGHLLAEMRVLVHHHVPPRCHFCRKLEVLCHGNEWLLLLRCMLTGRELSGWVLWLLCFQLCRWQASGRGGHILILAERTWGNLLWGLVFWSSLLRGSSFVWICCSLRFLAIVN